MSKTAYPRKIRSAAEVEKLPYVGPKTVLKVRTGNSCAFLLASNLVNFQIKEYLSVGMIEETRNLQNDPYYQTLASFTSIYGIGNFTAKLLYTKGMRTLQHLEGYYRNELKTTKNKANIEGMLHSLALKDDFKLK